MRKKSTKQRGSRTHGGGSQKKRRGHGNRGGHGFAGVGKRGGQKKSRYLAKGIQPYGKQKKYKKKKAVKTLNLKQLDQLIDKWVKEGKATKEGDTYTLDLNKLGYSKLLGTGKFARKINITCKSASQSAKKKIEDAGGVCSE